MTKTRAINPRELQRRGSRYGSRMQRTIAPSIAAYMRKPTGTSSMFRALLTRECTSANLDPPIPCATTDDLTRIELGMGASFMLTRNAEKPARHRTISAKGTIALRHFPRRQSTKSTPKLNGSPS